MQIYAQRQTMSHPHIMYTLLSLYISCVRVLCCTILCQPVVWEGGGGACLCGSCKTHSPFMHTRPDQTRPCTHTHTHTYSNIRAFKSALRTHVDTCVWRDAHHQRCGCSSPRMQQLHGVHSIVPEKPCRRTPDANVSVCIRT